MRCIYCEKEFKELSDEHVIQNAIGGLLSSKSICCDSCNNVLISKNIDKPFCDIFAPFSSILDLKKSHSKESKPKYKAIGVYKGKEYELICKDCKILDCPELKKELKGLFDKKIFDEIEIKEIKFEIDNISFKQGLRKIAVNYATELGVNDIEGIEVIKENDKVTSVNFKQLVIPFIPLTLLDNAIERYKENNLYHSLILFNKDHKLWCYIELFSTFKFYVLLNDNYKGKDICESYCQLVEKQDKTLKQFHIRRPKDVLILSQMYGIEPTLDEKELNDRINKSILLKSNKEDFYKRNNILVEQVCVKTLLEVMNDKKMFEDYKNEFKYYLKQEEKEEEDPSYVIDKSRYRVTLFDGTSYPDMIMRLLTKDKNIPKVYMENKFMDISDYVIKKMLERISRNKSKEQ